MNIYLFSGVNDTGETPAINSCHEETTKKPKISPNFAN
jgi:hypothetical protein